MELWEIAGRPVMLGDEAGYCRICGLPRVGLRFDDWVRDTFTDHDKLIDGTIICQACQFLFAESSELLRDKVGKEKPQRMRNYSHFVVDGVWYTLSKAEKAQMKELLLGASFPELAVVAESGQKHLLFRAKWNAAGGRKGYVQFEEQSVVVDPDALLFYIDKMESLLTLFSKAEIDSGQYAQHRIIKFGMNEWQAIESKLKVVRGTALFQLALFLSQRGGSDGVGTEDSGSVVADLARDVVGVQTQVHEHLGAIREQHQIGGVHKQSGQVHQLALFENER